MTRHEPHSQTSLSPSKLPALDGDTSTDPAIIREHSFDWGSVKIVPQMVIFPRTNADIRRLVDYVREHKAETPSLSITCRSAGTDVTGGPLNESIILDFMRYFTKLEIEHDYARVQPGVYYRDFDEETMKRRLFLPSAPESRDLCALGGMIANNSGGEKTLRYGKTKDYVEELRVILQDGNEYVLTEISEEELEDKKKLETFEGQVYRDMHAMLNERYEEIEQAAPTVSKNSTGYNLWDVWDRERKTFDLSKLFVGSQGTLGVITDAKVRLIAPKDHAKMMSILIPDPQTLSKVIGRLLPLDLEALEIYDRSAIVLLTQHMPTLIRSLGWKAVPLGARFLPDLLKFVKDRPEFVLTAEFAEHTEAQVDDKLAEAREILEEMDIGYHEVRSEAEAEKYHVMRKASFPVLHGLKRLEPLTFIDDVVVEPAQLGEFLPELKEILDRQEVKHAIIGHIGNGNLHIITLMDLERPDIAEKNDRMAREVNQLVADFGGSLSGEHNDGRARGPFLELMYGSDIVDCFRRTKEIFDPHDIFNPGNKIDVDWDHTLDHIRTERPHNLRPQRSGWRTAGWVAGLALAGAAFLRWRRSLRTPRS